MSDERLLDAIREIGVVRPGDTLILSTPGGRLTGEQAVDIKHAVEQLVPGVNVVIIGLQVTVQRQADLEPPVVGDPL